MNFIKTFEDFFPPDWCKDTISYFENNKSLHVDGYMGKWGILGNTEICINLGDERWQSLVDGLDESVALYKKDYDLLDTNISPWGLFQYCQLMKYKQGESYTQEHCEHGPGIDGNLIDLKRVIAWQINLNTISNNGGETGFRYYDHTISPNEGSLTFWPAGWTHMHKGLVSSDNEKYIITGWFNFL